MTPTLNIALSGLKAAETRLANSANNVANAGSTRSVKDGVEVSEPYKPTRVAQTSQAEGGVSTKVVEDGNPTTPVFDPGNADADDNGFVQYPNVDLAEEAVDQVVATYDFKANLNVVKADKSMFDKLLDIFG